MLFTRRAAWRYNGRQSCHLDTFLVCELAGYIGRGREPNHPRRRELELINLLKSIVNEKEGESARDLFWQTHDFSKFGKVDDVLVHIDWLVDGCNSGNPISWDDATRDFNNDRVLRYNTTIVCSHGCENRKKLKQLASLIIGSGYYSQPEQTSPFVPFTSLEDAINRTILQSDMTEKTCIAGCNGKRHIVKNLDAVNMPRLLVVAASEDKVQFKEFSSTLNIGEAQYELVGVAFKSPGHYACTAKLRSRGGWVTFNDLEPGENMHPTRRFQTPPSSLQDARACRWWYVRKSSEDVIDLSDAATHFPEPCFHS
jgi:hypothetical protein